MSTVSAEESGKKHEAKVLRNEKNRIEECLQQIFRGREQGDLRQKISPQHSGGFQLQTRRSEHWTVDPFWEMGRPTPAQQQDKHRPSSTPTGPEQYAPMPIEEDEIDSETDQQPSIL